MVGDSTTRAAEPQLPVVVAFDFDGTLTKADTFALFVAWQQPVVSVLWHWAATAPLLAAYAFGLTGNETHKMALFARRFAGMPEADYRAHASRFGVERLPRLLRPTAVQRMRAHRAAGHAIVIVTASFADWISPWALREGVADVVGSVPEIREGKLTGRMAGQNCHGAEKVRRLLAKYPERTKYRLVAYGDSRGDRELLAAADEAHYRSFA